MVALCFPLGVIICSILSLYDASYRTHYGMERLAIIVPVGASAIPFIYFQFYNDVWSSCVFVSTIAFAMARMASSALSLPRHVSFNRAYVGFRLIVLLPALYAIIRTSPCRYPVASEFIKYSFYNTAGILSYTLRILERRGVCTDPRISLFVMHAATVTSAIQFSRHLLRAFLSSPALSIAECGGWTWVCWPLEHPRRRAQMYWTCHLRPSGLVLHLLFSIWKVNNYDLCHMYSREMYCTVVSFISSERVPLSNYHHNTLN